MALTFTPGNKVQNDQTIGLQTGIDINDTGVPGTDTDVLFTDSDVATLDGLVQGYMVTDTTFASAIGGAKRTGVMTIESNSSPVTGIRFTDALVGGDGVLNDDPSGLKTVDGHDIVLTAISDTVVLGIDATDGTVVFAIQMIINDTSGTLKTIDLVMITYQAVQHNDATNPDDPVDLGSFLRIEASDTSSLFDFSALDATKFLYGVVGTTSGAFLVIGKDPNIVTSGPNGGEPVKGNGAGDLINTSKGGGGTTIGINNQHFTGDSDTTTVEQGAYFTYLTGNTAGTYGDADSIVKQSLVPATTARLQVSQTQAEGQTSPGMQLSTLNYDINDFADGRDFVADIKAGGTTAGADAAIQTIKIYNDVLTDAPDVFNVAGMANGETVVGGVYTLTKIDANTVRIVGLTDNDWVEWSTVTPHNRVLVEAVSGKWDIGAFEIDRANTQAAPIGQQIVIDDDAPAIGAISNITVNFVKDATSSTLLNQTSSVDASDTIKIVDFRGDGSGANGADVVVNGVTLKAQLSDNDTVVRYFQDLNGNSVYNAGVDTLYYTYQLIDAVGGDGILDTAQFTVHLDAPSVGPDFNLNDLPSGQNGFAILAARPAAGGPIDPDGPALIFIGRDVGDTINTSKGGGPTTIGNSNQMIDPASSRDPNGEGIYVAYVNDPVDNFVSGIVGGLTHKEATDFNNIQYDGGTLEVDGAFFKIVQVQGNPSFATARISAFDTPDALEGTAFADHDFNADPAVVITEVTISGSGGIITYLRSGGDILGVIDWDPTGGVVGSVEVAGLIAGDTIHFKTTGDLHDVALIEGIAGKFDIGDFGLDIFTPTPDQVLDFTVKITDDDTNSSMSTHYVGIDGTDGGGVDFPI